MGTFCFAHDPHASLRYYTIKCNVTFIYIVLLCAWVKKKQKQKIEAYNDYNGNTINLIVYQNAEKFTPGVYVSLRE